MPTCCFECTECSDGEYSYHKGNEVPNIYNLVSASGYWCSSHTDDFLLSIQMPACAPSVQTTPGPMETTHSAS